jgi:hypothetical protein
MVRRPIMMNIFSRIRKGEKNSENNMGRLTWMLVKIMTR